MIEPIQEQPSESLREQFISGLGQRATEISYADTILEQILQQWVNRCQTAWPDVNASPKSFVFHCAQKIPEEKSIKEGLQQLSTDLWLAFACLQGDAKARSEYEKILLQLAVPIHNDLGLADDRRQDVLQHLRELTVVGTPKRQPVLLQYQGRSRIKTWLRKIVKHHSLRLTKERPHCDIDDMINLDEFPYGETDPELNIIQHQSKSAFRTAFRKAVADLTPEQRNLLRFVVVEGLTGAQISLIFQCDASTVCRNLRKIRDRLAHRTRKFIRQAWGGSPQAMQSMFHVVDSQLHATFADLLVADKNPQEIQIN